MLKNEIKIGPRPLLLMCFHLGSLKERCFLIPFQEAFRSAFARVRVVAPSSEKFSTGWK